jgi:hypothetical protein
LVGSVRGIERPANAPRRFLFLAAVDKLEPDASAVLIVHAPPSGEKLQ